VCSPDYVRNESTAVFSHTCNWVSSLFELETVRLQIHAFATVIMRTVSLIPVGRTNSGKKSGNSPIGDQILAQEPFLFLI
jgi:hypothetical protein